MPARSKRSSARSVSFSPVGGGAGSAFSPVGSAYDGRYSPLSDEWTPPHVNKEAKPSILKESRALPPSGDASDAKRCAERRSVLGRVGKCLSRMTIRPCQKRGPDDDGDTHPTSRGTHRTRDEYLAEYYDHEYGREYLRDAGDLVEDDELDKIRASMKGEGTEKGKGKDGAVDDYDHVECLMCASPLLQDLNDEMRCRISFKKTVMGEPAN